MKFYPEDRVTLERGPNDEIEVHYDGMATVYPFNGDNLKAASELACAYMELAETHVLFFGVALAEVLGVQYINLEDGKLWIFE